MKEKIKFFLTLLGYEHTNFFYIIINTNIGTLRIESYSIGILMEMSHHFCFKNSRTASIRVYNKCNISINDENEYTS